MRILTVGLLQSRSLIPILRRVLERERIKGSVL